MNFFTNLSLLLSLCFFSSFSLAFNAQAAVNIKGKSKNKGKIRTKVQVETDDKKDLQPREIPGAELFWELYRQPNQLHVNDCSNKCRRYYELLKKKGYNVQIVIVKPWASRMRHALVRIKDEAGLYRHFDPVRGVRDFSLEDFGRILEVITAEDFNRYAMEFPS